MTWMKGRENLECDGQSFFFPLRPYISSMPPLESRGH